MSIGTFLYDTLIASGAWLSVLQGFWTTLRITAISLLCGTLLAVPICAMRLSGRRLVSVPAKAYVALVRGTPVLMLLMLFYYVVFASSRIDAAWIAVVAFTLHTGAIVSEIMATAVRAVAAGQIDAAHALGMRGFETFRSVTLPQALWVGLPVYRTAVINLLQWTSVVGYISITDLTRAINFISSRTMQPLFMLFVGILLYLALAYLITGAFALIERHRFGPSFRTDGRNKR